MAARLRRVGTMPAELAREAAPLVEQAVKATAAAGTTPDGEAWAPRKRDGGRALANAASAVSAAAVGASVRVTLTGVEVFHHLGAGVPKRKILPDGGAGVPPKIAEGCLVAARRVWARLMGAGA
jgi:hypothetical protein